jgi:hypothetical protein
MKIKVLRSLLCVLPAGAMALAAPLAVSTPVHSRPDASSPAISVLKAGTEPVAAMSLASMPPGWMAVELPGPFEGYVENKDLTKSLDVKPGTSIRVTPKPDGGVLTIAEKADKTTITGLRGKWTQITLEKKLLGYINVGTTPTNVASTTTPATSASQASAPAPMGASPVSPGVYGSAAAGQAAAMVNLGDGGSSGLARQFVGRLVSTRRALAPRRPYDYALNDDAGKRYAYLDISKLLLTEQIEKYIDHSVVIFGAAKNAPGGKDIVIEAESLHLK